MKKVRQSNIELLRMIAMFMILVIHANMVSLPHPTTDDLLSNTIPTITRYFIESFGIVGVDIFVLISGWFLINTRAKSFYSFFFQILMLWGGVFFTYALHGECATFSKECFRSPCIHEVGLVYQSLYRFNDFSACT